jgi:hypothetical protein
MGNEPAKPAQQAQAAEDAYCPNIQCFSSEKLPPGSSCPSCGTEIAKMKYWEFTRIMNEKKKFQMLQERLERGDVELVIKANETDDKIALDIKRELVNLALLEADSSILARSSSSLSKNVTDQVLGTGFRLLMSENKIIIRQNELLLRNMSKLVTILSKK